MNFKSAGATMAIGGVLALLLLLGGWFLLIGPTTTKLTETQEERTNLEDFLDQSRTKLAQLQAAEKNLPATQQAESQLTTVFPDTAEQLRFFEELTDVARAAGIDPKNITSLAPAAPAPVIEGGSSNPAELRELAAQAEIAPQTVTMTVTASNDQVRRLLEGLERMDRAFFISNLSVSGEGGQATTTISGTTFVAPPLLDPDERAAAEAAQATAAGDGEAAQGDAAGDSEG